ncbi:hypothetical protein SCLCIDRAFT_105957, partial [Scleroderma citrinum Foug A]
ILCFPHALNTCTKHVIDNLTDADFSEVVRVWVDSLGHTVDKDAYLKALQRDPISLGHNIVRVVHASSLHCESFQETISNGNLKKYWTDKNGKVIELPFLELLHDVKTCWDSIYFMLNCLCMYRQVLDHFFQLLVHRDIVSWKLGTTEWQVLENIEMVLEIPHGAQQKMSGESTPLLGNAVPNFEAVMVQWEALSKLAPQCASFICPGLECAKDYYTHMGKTCAYVVTMGKLWATNWKLA